MNESRLESLPKKLLIKVLCGVDHDDLDQLFRVSTTIREAALIAKSCHFSYTTPRKACKFPMESDCKELSQFSEIKTPMAPARRPRMLEKIPFDVIIQTSLG